jgi:hypothetical protein
MQATRPDQLLDLPRVQGPPDARCLFFKRKQPRRHACTICMRVTLAACAEGSSDGGTIGAMITRRHSIGLLGASVLLSAGR